jgi:hypothetical protein
MAITKQGGRQWPLVAKVSFGFADHSASGAADECIDLPAGASVIGASITITEVYNSATSDLLELAGAGITVGGADNGSTLGTYEASSLDMTALTVNTAVTLEWTGSGAAPTTGAGFALVEYIQDGKANEVVPV